LKRQFLFIVIAKLTAAKIELLLQETADVLKEITD